jgi:hypothetical protein
MVEGRYSECLYRRLVFDHRFFLFLSRDADLTSGSRSVFEWIGRMLRMRTVSAPLYVFERMLYFLLNLPIPVYASFVAMLLKPFPGFLGYYLRGAYYSGRAIAVGRQYHRPGGCRPRQGRELRNR